MTVIHKTVRRAGYAFALLSLVGACALPRSGPTRDEILASTNDGTGNVHVVQVTDSVAAAARSVQRLGFDSNFLGAPTLRADRISPGDALSVTVLSLIHI